MRTYQHNLSRLMIRLKVPGLLSLLLIAVSAQAEPGVLINSDHPARVEGRYIVELHEAVPTGAAAQAESLLAELKARHESIAAQYGGRIRHHYTSLFNGFSAAMPAEQAMALTRDPRVKSVSQVVRYELAGSQSNPDWALDRIDQRSRSLDGIYGWGPYDGSGIHVYVFDTGIRDTHQDFEGRVRPGFTAIDDGWGTNDPNGHGTHVAGLAGGKTYGAAKKVTLYPVRVCNLSGSCFSDDILAGLEWVKNEQYRDSGRRGKAIANMSLAGPVDTVLESHISSFLNDPDVGVIVVAAAGNDGADACNYTPARMAAVITVAATDRNDKRSTDFSNNGESNYGSCVDLFAPGSEVLSAWKTHDTATQHMWGTSQAAPLVAGRVALLLQQSPGLSPAQVETEITGYTATHDVVSDAKPEAGTPNTLLYNKDDLYTPAVQALFSTCSGGHVSKPIYTVHWDGDYGAESEYYNVDRTFSGTWGRMYDGTATSTTITVNSGETFKVRARYTISKGTSAYRSTGTITAPNCDGVDPY